MKISKENILTLKNELSKEVSFATIALNPQATKKSKNFFQRNWGKLSGNETTQTTRYMKHLYRLGETIEKLEKQNSESINKEEILALVGSILQQNGTPIAEIYPFFTIFNTVWKDHAAPIYAKIADSEEYVEFKVEKNCLVAKKIFSASEYEEEEEMEETEEEEEENDDFTGNNESEITHYLHRKRLTLISLKSLTPEEAEAPLFTDVKGNIYKVGSEISYSDFLPKNTIKEAPSTSDGFHFKGNTSFEQLNISSFKPIHADLDPLTIERIEKGRKFLKESLDKYSKKQNLTFNIEKRKSLTLQRQIAENINDFAIGKRKKTIFVANVFSCLFAIFCGITTGYAMFGLLAGISLSLPIVAPIALGIAAFIFIAGYREKNRVTPYYAILSLLIAVIPLTLLALGPFAAAIYMACLVTAAGIYMNRFFSKNGNKTAFLALSRQGKGLIEITKENGITYRLAPKWQLALVIFVLAGVLPVSLLWGFLTINFMISLILLNPVGLLIFLTSALIFIGVTLIVGYRSPKAYFTLLLVTAVLLLVIATGGFGLLGAIPAFALIQGVVCTMIASVIFSVVSTNMMVLLSRGVATLLHSMQEKGIWRTFADLFTPKNPNANLLEKAIYIILILIAFSLVILGVFATFNSSRTLLNEKFLTTWFSFSSDLANIISTSLVGLGLLGQSAFLLLTSSSFIKNIFVPSITGIFSLLSSGLKTLKNKITGLLTNRELVETTNESTSDASDATLFNKVGFYFMLMLNALGNGMLASALGFGPDIVSTAGGKITAGLGSASSGLLENIGAFAADNKNESTRMEAINERLSNLPIQPTRISSSPGTTDTSDSTLTPDSNDSSSGSSSPTPSDNNNDNSLPINVVLGNKPKQENSAKQLRKFGLLCQFNEYHTRETKKGSTVGATLYYPLKKSS